MLQPYDSDVLPQWNWAGMVDESQHLVVSKQFPLTSALLPNLALPLTKNDMGQSYRLGNLLNVWYSGNLFSNDSTVTEHALEHDLKMFWDSLNGRTNMTFKDCRTPFRQLYMKYEAAMIVPLQCPRTHSCLGQFLAEHLMPTWMTPEYLNTSMDMNTSLALARA